MVADVGRSLRAITKSAAPAAQRTASLARQVGVLGTAYLAARGAAGLFNKTIGAAAQYEMREVTVKAMFGKESEKNAKRYLDFVQSRADISMFTMDDFLDAGKSFIPTTKDNKQLERMINLAERLGAIDPEQGLTGGAYALREYFSGDAVSLVERFEMPRSVLNDWKNLPLEQQLTNLDKYFNKIGATNELLEAQSRTSLGQYRKALGQINRAFREMGTEGLAKINPLLSDFNKYLSSDKFKKFKGWATDMFSGLVEGASQAVRKTVDFINVNFVDNPEFQKLPTVQQKITFVFDKFGEVFQAWWSGGGESKVMAAANKLTDVVATVLQNSGPLVDAALKLGVAIGEGIRQGIMNSFQLPESVLNLVPGAETPQKQRLIDFNKKMEVTPDNVPLLGDGAVMQAPTKKKGFLGLGFSGGIQNVPYNNMPARLHAGEAVLPREEAKRYRGESSANYGNGGKSAPTININGTINVNNGMDYQTFVRSLAHDLAQ
ncbi:hypothetical protein M2277_006443 [Paenibacillus sp. LBL]|uniref:hypothetical protein n=1 Tax=Paenibacillus sp. LBL TaxID=2940563 RepID=UPI0024757288|nr:hypothetical protein [Paenibacillus sp. LBL]MDH6675722.1 hypothetical protein [Paenibacillus sp. LBL]